MPYNLRKVEQEKINKEKLHIVLLSGKGSSETFWGYTRFEVETWHSKQRGWTIGTSVNVQAMKPAKGRK